MCVFRLRLAIQTHTRTLTPNPGTNHLSRLGERRDSRCLAEVHCLQLRRDYSQRRRCCRTARHRGSSFGKVFSSFLYEFPLKALLQEAQTGSRAGRRHRTDFG
jgi:hypothetical protein